MIQMNYEVITIEDCLENYVMEGKSVVISNGQVVGFETEE